ncbi:32021_t:CDS:1, partial [Gigaspora margarita]
FNSFEDALRESEPKIEEMDAERNFPSFDRYHRFYENTYDQEDENTNQEDKNTNNTYDREFFSF